MHKHWGSIRIGWSNTKPLAQIFGLCLFFLRLLVYPSLAESLDSHSSEFSLSLSVLCSARGDRTNPRNLQVPTPSMFSMFSMFLYSLDLLHHHPVSSEGEWYETTGTHLWTRMFGLLSTRIPIPSLNLFYP
jgi:hypothetical protein